MINYDIFSKHYDKLYGESKEIADIIIKIINDHNEHACDILEMACGTGSVLNNIPNKYNKTGFDLSPGMISVAKTKIENANLFLGNMTSFNVSQKFDVIYCVYDAINHLLTIENWKKTFLNAYKCLMPNGIFIFDMNTIHKLNKMVSEPPYIHSYEKNYFIMNITKKSGNIFNWNIKIFENIGAEKYKLLEENIRETTYPYKKILDIINNIFQKVTIQGAKDNIPSDKTDRLIFICKKKEKVKSEI